MPQYKHPATVRPICHQHRSTLTCSPRCIQRIGLQQPHLLLRWCACLQCYQLLLTCQDQAVALPAPSSPLSAMCTALLGLPSPLPTPSIFFTTSMPSMTAQQGSGLDREHNSCSQVLTCALETFEML